MNKTKLEALRQKFFNHCVDPYRIDDNMEESKAPINMYAEDVWNWILSNCLQKEEEKKEELWQFFVRGNDHDYTGDPNDIKADFERYYQAYVKGEIKANPNHQLNK